MKQRGLGKGLDALMGEHVQPDGENIKEIDVLLIDNDKNQPRKYFDQEKLDELAQSVAVHGVLEPIIVYANGDRYTIVAGERRFRAAKIAGLKKMPAIIRRYDNQETILEHALIENIQREDLNPMEQAVALKQLLTAYNLTQEEVAKRVSKSRSAIANLTRLLALPPTVQQLVREDTLSAGHAKCLLALETPALIEQAAQTVIAKKLSVRQTEELVRGLQNPQKKTKETAKRPALDAELKAAQEALCEALETKVKIQGDNRKGKIIIDYYNKEQLEQLYEAMTSIK